jgi:hypothetical protein
LPPKVISRLVRTWESGRAGPSVRRRWWWTAQRVTLGLAADGTVDSHMSPKRPSAVNRGINASYTTDYMYQCAILQSAGGRGRCLGSERRSTRMCFPGGAFVHKKGWCLSCNSDHHVAKTLPERPGNLASTPWCICGLTGDVGVDFESLERRFL